MRYLPDSAKAPLMRDFCLSREEPNWGCPVLSVYCFRVTAGPVPASRPKRAFRRSGRALAAGGKQSCDADAAGHSSVAKAQARPHDRLKTKGVVSALHRRCVLERLEQSRPCRGRFPLGGGSDPVGPRDACIRSKRAVSVARIWSLKAAGSSPVRWSQRRGSLI